jgi:hypothetical protein
VEPVHTLGVGAPVIGDAQAIPDVDPLDDQDPVLLLDVASRLDVVHLGIDFDLTRLQRAGKGAGQSAAGGRHHVVERGRVGWVLRRRDPIVLGHLVVHAERHRLGFGGKVGKSLRTAEPFDSHP